MVDVEYETTEGTVGEPYFKFDREGIWYAVRFVREIGDHAEFKLGKGKNAVPAKVWLVEHMGKDYQLSITSTRLADALAKAIEKTPGAKSYADLHPKLEVKADGRDTERNYQTRWPKNRSTTLDVRAGTTEEIPQ